MKKKPIESSFLPLCAKFQQTAIVLDVGMKIIEDMTGVKYSEIGDDFNEILEQIEVEFLLQEAER